jgi:hypothetical protein
VRARVRARLRARLRARARARVTVRVWAAGRARVRDRDRARVKVVRSAFALPAPPATAGMLTEPLSFLMVPPNLLATCVIGGIEHRALGIGRH